MRNTILLASGLALLGCSDRNFNTPQKLNVPRVLAIQAEPPQPRLGEATMLQALVYMPPGDPGENATYAWSWCPFTTSANNGYQCPIDQTAFDQFYASLGLGAAPLLDLGAGKTATLVNPFPAALLAQLCTNAPALPGEADAAVPNSASAAQSQKIKDCLAVGYEITIRLTIAGTSTGKLDAIFFVRLPTDDSVPGNQNPVMGGIQASWPEAPDAGPPSVDGGANSIDTSPAEIDAAAPVDGGAPVDGSASPVDAAEIDVGPTDYSYGVVLDDAYSITLPRQEKLQLHLQLPRASSEPLTPAQIQANPSGRVTEGLNVFWFAEAGDFGDDPENGMNTNYLGSPEDPNALFKTATDNKWVLPKVEDFKGDKTRIIIVVRDNRGGVGWTMATATLGAEKAP